ncbi:methyl-accepting chemotaxis protein [Bacteriovorax sp. PP10]|uniref:Methyl-accepting chemotaxis protein n=1 Tax=Bacteriovorax antarcticus TaxID=3088717 RepID=A0ABU5VXL0_9BACT|nr:methyl-accepting chemotaxis protein [Bacteriovorax sp. PP10]MEA9357798.1 methyl-accepting chemotaxis protein [Bacteriovorax sp. PP10]
MAHSLGRKISFGQIVSFLFFLSFAAFVIFYLSNIKSTNLKNLKLNFSHYRYSQKTKIHVVQIQQFISDIGATRGEDGLDDGLKEAENNYRALLQNIDEERKLASENNNQEMMVSLDTIKKLSDLYYKTGVTMANLYITKGTKAGNTYMPNFDKASLELQKEVDAFLKQATVNFTEDINKIAQDIELILRLSIWAPLAALVGFSIFSYNFIKKLTRQLSELTNELNQTTPLLINSSDSMKFLSAELSTCATQQAAAVQETAASIEEIAAMIGRNSDNANNAKVSSQESLESVKSGQKALVEMLNAMNEISENNDSFNSFMSKNNAELSEMVQVIKNIADKTNVINDIVFQTKLLSFNASVEAARAGEQGKGFAVVAEEIGNLAQMSGSAANEIKIQLDESINKVNKIVSTTKSQVEILIHDGKDKIALGIDKAKQCDLILNEISNASASAQSLVSEVAGASREQSQGIDEVNKAMGLIDEITNKNSAASQSVSENANQVMQLSTSVKDTATKLFTLING